MARAADLFPIELIWHPLERLSGALTNALYGATWLPDPARFNFVRVATDPVVNAVDKATTHLSETLGPLFTVVIGALLILASVYFLGKLLKLLMVGQARDILTAAVTRNAYLAMASGMGVTVLRPVPLFCAETIARIAANRKWVVAAYLITAFIVTPALVIILVGVL